MAASARGEHFGGRIERADDRHAGRGADDQRRGTPAHRRCVDRRFERGGLGRGGGGADVPQQHDEFVAADARDHVGGAHLAHERRRDRLEHGVAGGMAVTIVDRLEFIEIEIDQRRAHAVALDVGERAREFALEAAAVERLGERIDIDPRLEVRRCARAKLSSSAASRSTSAASRMATARAGAASPACARRRVLPIWPRSRCSRRGCVQPSWQRLGNRLGNRLALRPCRFFMGLPAANRGKIAFGRSCFSARRCPPPPAPAKTASATY